MRVLILMALLSGCATSRPVAPARPLTAYDYEMRSRCVAFLATDTSANPGWDAYCRQHLAYVATTERQQAAVAAYAESRARTLAIFEAIASGERTRAEMLNRPSGETRCKSEVTGNQIDTTCKEK